MLTAYDGNTITYDAIGNPTSDGTWSYTWKHGRELYAMETSGKRLVYTYGADGLRSTKTVRYRYYDDAGTLTLQHINKFQYVYTDGLLTRAKITTTRTDGQVVNDRTMWFYYNASGVPVSMNFNGTIYYYVTNPQGDVIAILDANGAVKVEYTYDAWGNILTTTGPDANGIGKINPLRYRGYVYDYETGLYYLRSRYYNPKTGRFINADGYASTGQGVIGNNMFTYCGNNPIARMDGDGEAWETVWDIISLASSVAEVIANPADPWAWAGLIGDVVDVALPGIGGLGESVDAIKTTCRVIDKGDDIIDAAKQTYRAAKAADDIKHATGVYTVLYQGGQHYIGKGGFKRAITSAAEHMSGTNKVVAIVWAPTSSRNGAFVAEYMLQSVFGVGKKAANSFNKIWSPGKRLLNMLQ